MLKGNDDNGNLLVKKTAIKRLKIPKNALINVLPKLTNRSYKVAKINQLGGRQKKSKVKKSKKKATAKKGKGKKTIANKQAALLARFITKR